MPDAITRNVIIIGSGPAGLTAALYTARANLQPLAHRRDRGRRSADADDAGREFPGPPRRHHGARPDGRDARAGREVRRRDHPGQRHQRRPVRQPFVVKTVGAPSTRRKTLIIATGASARLLGLPSERTLMGHGVSTCATCDGYFFRGQEIAVVGGGDSAMEEAMFLTRFAYQGHRRASARHAARVEDHAGQGAREPEDRVDARQRGRGDQGRRQGRSDRRWCCATTRPASAPRFR